jgi:hypothetical protein
MVKKVKFVKLYIYIFFLFYFLFIYFIFYSFILSYFIYLFIYLFIIGASVCSEGRQGHVDILPCAERTRVSEELFGGGREGVCGGGREGLKVILIMIYVVQVVEN